MKKLILALLVLTLIPMAALADGLYYGSDDETAASLAEAAATLIPVDTKAEETSVKALDALASDPSGIVLLGNAGLIEGLQGYAETDVEKDIQPAVLLGQTDLYLVCSADTAAEAGFSDLGGMADYLKDNEYGLQLMRCFEASHEDYASYVLMNDLYFDSDMFVDKTDKLESLDAGQYVLVVDTADALALQAQGHVVLGALTAERTADFPNLACAAECGLPVVPGGYYALFVKAGSKAADLQELALDESVLTELHLHQPQEGISVPDDCVAYVDYMTAEGLCFYR